MLPRIVPTLTRRAAAKAPVNIGGRISVGNYDSFQDAVTKPGRKSQVYISKSRNPYLNLSIEHYLLQKSPEDSTILFLYSNAPSVIIGRNQNPWNEVNLGLLRNEPLGVRLVRRRSGGGTVFHDEGNVNYSVICPTPAFNRDKHAEMVVRALQKLGVDKARVNDRHDIVVDKILKGEDTERPFKISGSAYKLTRLRSLHHGTCLLSSPHLHAISRYLRSPAKPFIKARGVESVSSPITNVGLTRVPFEDAVVSEFNSMYAGGAPMYLDRLHVQDTPEVDAGFSELKSDDWIYLQTPQFEFSTDFIAKDDAGRRIRDAWSLPSPHEFTSNLTVRNGHIISIDVGFRGRVPKQVEKQIGSFLINRKFHKVQDWESAFLSGKLQSEFPEYWNIVQKPGKALNQLLGCGKEYELESYVAQWGFSKAEVAETKRWQQKAAEAEKVRFRRV